MVCGGFSLTLGLLVVWGVRWVILYEELTMERSNQAAGKKVQTSSMRGELTRLELADVWKVSVDFWQIRVTVTDVRVVAMPRFGNKIDR